MARVGRVIFVTGTGTDVGKTHVVCALLRAARARGLDIDATKPIATGVASASEDDARHAAALGRVARVPCFAYEPPLSPHLAARLAGRPIVVEQIVAHVAALARAHELVVVEGAGGLFSPLGTGADNASLVRALAPDCTVLVASDRLGVLHDLSATLVASRTREVRVDEVVLSAPAIADASTGTNAVECRALGIADVAATFPRASDDDARSLAAANALLDRVQSASASGGGRP